MTRYDTHAMTRTRVLVFLVFSEGKVVMSSFCHPCHPCLPCPFWPCPCLPCLVGRVLLVILVFLVRVTVRVGLRSGLGLAPAATCRRTNVATTPDMASSNCRPCLLQPREGCRPVGYHRTDKARKKNSAVADHVTHTHRSHMAVSQPRGVSFIYSRLPSAVQPPKAGFTSCLALPPRQLPPHPPTHKAQTQPRPLCFWRLSSYRPLPNTKVVTSSCCP
jgi:hypothetical protein